MLCLPDPDGATTLIGNWIRNGLPKDAIVADLTTMPPILRVIGETVHHAGHVGSASLVKAVNQFVYLSLQFGFCEGTPVSTRAGSS